MSYAATITSKGQLTIPSQLRKLLPDRMVELEQTDDGILIRPVTSVAGSLAKYGKDTPDMKSVREEVWSGVVRERK